MSTVIPVILCGGSGTRLWPLSRSGFPKQFLTLSGSTSLFQQALARMQSVGVKGAQSEFVVGPPIVVTNEEHRFLALEQLRELGTVDSSLLLEPLGRNTAPAVTLAALQSTQAKGVDPILVVTPADQTVTNEVSFIEAVQNCIRLIEADSSGKTVAILGINPDRPETGYGYIRRTNEKDLFDSFTVEQFVEKPDQKTAQTYIDDGHYLWNSGMFVLRASTWLSALEQFRPDIADATKKAWQARTADPAGNAVFIRPGKKQFSSIPSESIDYAVIEKCPQSNFSIKMVVLDAGWNDLGAWDAVWQVGNKDANGNVAVGDVLLYNTNDSIVHASNRLVGAVGLDNVVIIETADAVLVADKSKAQDVKKIVAQLEAQQREEKNLHRKVTRPWGWYDSIDEGARFKVKRIQVKPGASLSLQMHYHRAEHWIVVKGIAHIVNGDQELTLSENQSTYIPQGQTHRLSNPGSEPLEIIEVQSGSYLGEDDIVRFEDIYGR